MKIDIKEYESTYTLVDGVFKCSHENAEIERACCSGRDSEGLPSCGCNGQDSVYYPDCNNDDMTDEDALLLLIDSQEDDNDREEDF